MCLRTRDNSGHTVIKKPSSSRKTAVTSALKGVQICPYFRKHIPSVRTAPFRLRRCKTDHPKALLTGQMKHWWSPERRGPPEGVPHRPHGTLVVAANRPLTDFGGKTSIFSHSVYLFLREFCLQDSRGGSPVTSGLRQSALTWARAIPPQPTIPIIITVAP